MRFAQPISPSLLLLAASLSFSFAPTLAFAAPIGCAIGAGNAPIGWALQGAGGGVDGTATPFNPGGAVAGSTTCVIVSDTGPGVGTTSTGYFPSTNILPGTTNGSRMTSQIFTAAPGQDLRFNFMYFTTDGTGTFSDYARASLVNANNGSVLDLFTARTGFSDVVVPGIGFPSFPSQLTLSPGTATLQGDTFFLPDFGNTQYGPVRYQGGPGGSSEWNKAIFSFDSATAGDWSLQFTVANVGDQIYSSGLAFTSEVPGDPGNPLVPISTNPQGFDFQFAVTPGLTYTVDPEIATGYDYFINSGPNFQSVTLPDIGDGLYDIFLWDGIAWALKAPDWAALIPFDFGLGGVDRFRITGIETSAGLDPNDPLAFATTLAFAGGGTVNMSMNPITTTVAGVAAVPEPGTLAPYAAGLIALLLLTRRRKRIAPHVQVPLRC